MGRYPRSVPWWTWAALVPGLRPGVAGRGAQSRADQDVARRFKGARWALLKNSGDLTDEQAVTLRKLKRQGDQLWRPPRPVNR